MVDRARPALRRPLTALIVCGVLAWAVGACSPSEGEDAEVTDRPSSAAPAGAGTPAGAAKPTAGGTPTPTTAGTAAPSPAGTPNPTASATPARTPAGAGKVAMPEPGIAFDYQIGGAYAPPPGVRAVSRDRAAKPAPGLYNICYVNAFQAQPDATGWWREHHPDLLLRDAAGALVIDGDWDEALLDISTPAKRERLAEVVGEWIDGCATAGYQAVEADNLDSHERSKGLLTAEDDLAFGKLLVSRAHAAGLAIGQKNAAELAGRGRSIGFDFAVAEECGQYDECGAYADAFDNRVFVIEYQAEGLAAACETWGDTLSVVLRDLDVAPAGEAAHVRRTC
ncbi:endo alpha-1,4 polygalactosaminidase [Streptomyces sp. HNM0663]|uniref:Endo alpha-1,4 polygalactosaminidase n=1 Tax=Streptomyces chengmaiensis TaxID=3040919 RepID=A0ABT6HG34_9ACTN|nr:endo alpha-1,4 polygalactosaminidase [Streptomyces chengmaiensis]MDH2387286.1 endo alpha-1,4 polygalactosaminidase [Streptomyces chengmaiensis]